MLLSQLLPEVALMYPTKPAMSLGAQVITYEELAIQTESIAAGLQQLRIQPGDRVALLGNPSPLLAMAELASVAIGAVPVTVFPGLAPKEMISILENAAPKAVIFDTGNGDENMNEALLLCDVDLLISCRTGQADYSLEGFIAQERILDLKHHAEPDDLALLIYTGGTTGRSKGVMHSHRSIRAWAFMNSAKGVGNSPDRKRIIFNLAHLTGQFILWTTVFEGGCLVFPEDFPVTAEAVVALIEREQLRGLGTVGLLLRDIAYLENIKARSIQSIELITCGGAPLSQSTLLKVLEVFPNAHLIEVYSQTESGNFISYLSINQCLIDGQPQRLQSVGNPANLANWGQEPFQVRIVNEQGNDAAQGEIGEILVRGPQIMSGYWNNPEETNKVLRSGWLHTGDIGKLDADGYLYLVDRKKDMVIVNGSNVYCAEVETVVNQHPSILEAAVIGTPMSGEGEEVTAVVTVKPGTSISLQQLQQFCAGHLSYFKIPTQLSVVDSLPRTQAGKLNKAELRRPYWSDKERQIH